MSTHRLPYVSPFWDTTPRPGYATGVYFRLLPYPILKHEVRRTGRVVLHPHDLDMGHPDISWVPRRRLVGLTTARAKLHRLLCEGTFHAN